MKLHYYKQPYKNYTTVAFPMQDLATQFQLRNWCYKTFGEPGYKPDTAEVRWVDDIKYGEIRIDRDSDLMMFLLRWE